MERMKALNLKPPRPPDSLLGFKSISPEEYERRERKISKILRRSK